MLRSASAGTVIVGGLVLAGATAFRLWYTKHKRSKAVALGVDLGGSSAKIGVVTKDGKVLSQSTAPLEGKSLDEVCAVIRRAALEVLSIAGLRLQDVVGIGMCVPGMVDPENGQVLAASNFPEWPRPADLAGSIEKHLGLRPRVENDANVALLAEVWQGAAKGTRNAVMVTLGTGVGSAILSDGHLIRGGSGFAGEVGHTIIERNGRLSKGTGVRGIVEEYVSARAVAEIAREAVKDPQFSSVPSGLRDVSPDSISSKLVFDLASVNDELALKIVADTVDILAIVSINLARTLDTEIIIFGGGLVAAGDTLINGIRERFRFHNWNLGDPTCELKIACLGPSAGMVGAAYLGHLHSATQTFW